MEAPDAPRVCVPCENPRVSCSEGNIGKPLSVRIAAQKPDYLVDRIGVLSVDCA